MNVFDRAEAYVSLPWLMLVFDVPRVLSSVFILGAALNRQSSNTMLIIILCLAIIDLHFPSDYVT